MLEGATCPSTLLAKVAPPIGARTWSTNLGHPHDRSFSATGNVSRGASLLPTGMAPYL
jgi:hypothetical protein